MQSPYGPQRLSPRLAAPRLAFQETWHLETNHCHHGTIPHDAMQSCLVLRFPIPTVPTPASRHSRMPAGTCINMNKQRTHAGPVGSVLVIPTCRKRQKGHQRALQQRQESRVASRGNLAQTDQQVIQAVITRLICTVGLCAFFLAATCTVPPVSLASYLQELSPGSSAGTREDDAQAATAGPPLNKGNNSQTTLSTEASGGGKKRAEKTATVIDTTLQGTSAKSRSVSSASSVF